MQELRYSEDEVTEKMKILKQKEIESEGKKVWECPEIVFIVPIISVYRHCPSFGNIHWVPRYSTRFKSQFGTSNNYKLIRFLS